MQKQYLLNIQNMLHRLNSDRRSDSRFALPCCYSALKENISLAPLDLQQMYAIITVCLWYAHLPNDCINFKYQFLFHYFNKHDALNYSTGTDCMRDIKPHQCHYFDSTELCLLNFSTGNVIYLKLPDTCPLLVHLVIVYSHYQPTAPVLIMVLGFPSEF